jgi:hypothetical protein
MGAGKKVRISPRKATGVDMKGRLTLEKRATGGRKKGDVSVYRKAHPPNVEPHN